MSHEATVARRRVRHGLRRRTNWFELLRFVVVGASGFAANIAAYALAVHAFGLDYRVAAGVGVIAGVGNNFFWHRHWTFGARDGHAGFQALRFVVVYAFTFVIGLAALEVLVRSGTSRVIAQAMSQVLITPLNFLGHKLWSFDGRPSR